MGYELTDEQRDRYRATSIRSQRRKVALLAVDPAAMPNEPGFIGRLEPGDLMPQLDPHGLTSLSLFSGGGGLDLGFERAGFEHQVSFEVLDVCGETLRSNRPHWRVCSGSVDGDVRTANFSAFRGVDVVHCRPV